MGDFGIAFREATTCAEHPDGSRTCTDSDFQFDPGFGVAVQYQLGSLGVEPFELAGLADVTLAHGEDTDVIAGCLGLVVEVYWVHAFVAAGYAALPEPQPNPSYDDGSAQYDWYDTPEELNLSGFSFLLGGGVDIGVVAGDWGELGAVVQVFWPVVFGDDIAHRLSLRAGLSYAL